MSKRKKLYHGSPHRLDEIRPTIATGKGEASAREHAIYLADSPEEARLYALTRPRNNKRKGWAILDNKVHYVKGDPINKQGYVYEHEFDDYAPPPESDPGIGYRVYGAYKPTKRKRVRLKGIEDQFVEHPDKASYKARVKEWLASREKTSSYREGGSFTHEGTEYDLDHALSLADKQPVTSTRVKDLAWVLRHGKADPERVRRADLSAPLLVSRTKNGKPTVVDGFHRLTKANNEGVVSMPTRFVDRRELRKTSAVKHTLVTGHSGAGKTTLSKRLSEQSGLPIYELDKDPDIVEQLERQKAYIKASGGLDRGANAKLPTGPEWDIPFQRASKAGIDRALALKTPHVIEGTYLLDRDPNLLRDHELYLVDTPEDLVLNRRVERQRIKDIARGRYWGDDRAAGVRLRGQQLIDENKQGAARWRKADFVKKSALNKVMQQASTTKLASKRFRHRAGLIIRDEQGRLLVSEASPAQVAGGVSRISLPGGGIHDDENETRTPTKREIIRAARREALEELGMRIRNPRVLGSHSGELEDWWKDQQEKKRGVRFDGAAEHFVLASPGKKDMSLYNVEGDAFPGKYRDMTELTPLMEQDANRDSAFAQFNKKQLELLRGLQKTSSYVRGQHMTKSATKEERAGVRVGRKLYRPKVQAFMYDNQGRILAAKSQAAGSGLRAYSNYKFPGGGVEPGENIPEAARKELLEEAGYEAGGDLFEFGTPTPVDWDRKFRAQARKKGRGGYAGQYEYYAAGPIGKRNTSLLGSEGDALGGMEFVPIRALKRDLRKTSTDPNNEYGYFDTQKLVALKALEKELKQRGVKTASARLKQIALPPELTQFSNKYYQTYGQGRAINYGQERFDEYRRPRTRRERSLEEAYATKTSALLAADDLVKKAEKGVAQKSDPAEWARAKAQARAKMGGKHSARAMQLATQIYKKNGGGYRGAKPSSGTNKLKKWTKQDWQWSGKDTPGPGGTGVYLPKRSTDQLKSTDSGRDKLRAAAAAKRAATASGKQFSNHGLHVGRKRSDVR